MSGNGIHRTMRFCIGTNRSDYRCHEISDVGRFAGNTTASSRCPTLGMSTLPHDTAPSTRLLYQDRWFQRSDSSDVQATFLILSDRKTTQRIKSLYRKIRGPSSDVHYISRDMYEVENKSVMPASQSTFCFEYFTAVIRPYPNSRLRLS